MQIYEMTVGLRHCRIEETAATCERILLPDKELFSFGTIRSVVQIHSARSYFLIGKNLRARAQRSIIDEADSILTL
jgi:hypothetical protein